MPDPASGTATGLGHVPVPVDRARAFLLDVLIALGADREVATEVADHLIGANLAGHDSHGLLRILQYVDASDEGVLDASARGRALKESASLLLFDGERGLGQWSTRQALDWCVAHAAADGIAAAAVRHSNHIGRLGHYAEVAAARGMVSIVTVGLAAPDGGGVAPFGGIHRFVSTNPWCFGVPGREGEPMIADFATSQLAEGKVRVARYAGKALPQGVLLDPDGMPSTIPDDFYSGGAILPLGGELSGHKGWGLALASALFGGLSAIDDAETTAAGAMAAPPTVGPWMAGVFLMVLDPGWFGGADRYRAEVAGVLQAARQVEAAPGVEHVQVPGDPERGKRREREGGTLDVPVPLWDQLVALADRFRLAPPAA